MACTWIKASKKVITEWRDVNFQVVYNQTVLILSMKPLDYKQWYNHFFFAFLRWITITVKIHTCNCVIEWSNKV